MNYLRYQAKKYSGYLLDVISYLTNYVYSTRNKDPLLISGSPRSGTTWLAEIIAASESSRLIWEPLQEGNPTMATYPFKSKRPFLSKIQSEYNELDPFFKKLLNGRNLNSHTLRLKVNPDNLYKAFTNSRLVIKFVRGNGVVSYLQSRFNLPKPVVILRHPCAVVASQLRMGTWDDHPHLDPDLVNEYPNFNLLLKETESLEERLALTWAGDILSALHNSNNLQIIFYEDLVLNGEEELNKIFREWSDSNAPYGSLKKLNVQSSTSKTWSSKEDGMAKIQGWSKYLNEEKIERIFNIFKTLNIKYYDRNSFLPIKK
jgi:hypothetical protein